MAIKISDIPPQGITLDVDDRTDLAENGQATAHFKAIVTIKPEPKGIFHVTGNVNAETELECSRCLRRFPFTVRDAEFNFDLLPEGSLKTSAEHELGRSELDTEFYRGEEIEPKDLIREQILLALPMVPVHRQDCKGLCPICGADRNEKECGCSRDAPVPVKEENPFAVLKEIIKPKKE